MGICCLGTQRPVPCKRRSSRACRNHVLLNFLLPLGGVDRGVKALGPSDPPHSSTCPPVSLPADLQLMRRGLMPPGPGGSRDSVVASVLAGGSFALTTSKSRRKNIQQIPAEPIQRAQRQAPSAPSKSLCSCCFWSHFTRHSVGSGPQIASADAAREGDESWFWCWPGSQARWLGPLARAR